MPPNHSPAIISVNHVFKSVTDSTGTLDILRDIDFALAPRETAAIVGASGNRSSTQGLVAASGRVSRGGSADGGSEAAQLAVMTGEASPAIRVQRIIGIMGAPRLCRGPRGLPRHGHCLLVTFFEPPRLVRGAHGLEPARGGVRDSR